MEKRRATAVILAAVVLVIGVLLIVQAGFMFSRPFGDEKDSGNGVYIGAGVVYLGLGLALGWLSSRSLLRRRRST